MIKVWTGETTMAGGTVLTASNSGGSAGTALDTVQATSPGTVTIGATNPVIATTRSIRLQQPTVGGSGRARVWYEFAPAPVRLQSRFAFRNRIDPNAGNLLAAITDTSYGTPYPLQLSILPRSGTRHTVLHAAGTEVRDFGPLSFGSDVDDYYWADTYIHKGSTTTTPQGQLGFRLFNHSGTQLDEYVSASINVGTLNVPRMLWGGNTGVQQDQDVAWMRVTDEAAAFQGLPSMTVVPPGVTPPARPLPYEPGTVKINGFTATDSDGTIASIHAAVTAGPNAPIVTPVDVVGLNSGSVTFSLQLDALSAAQYTVAVWVKDNSGAESEHESVTFDTYAVSTPLSILESLSSSGWSQYGPSSDLVAAMSDGDDTTGYVSGYNPANAKLRWRISAVRPGRAFTITPTARREPSGGAAVTPVARLYRADGVTLVDTATTDTQSNPLTLGTTLTAPTIELDPGSLTEAQCVDLQVELDYDQTS